MYGFSEEEMLDFYNKVSSHVKEYRSQKGISQLELAIELGFANSSFISHAENPKVKTHHYSIEHLYKISKILDVDVKKFFP